MQERLRRDAVTANQPGDMQGNMQYVLQSTMQYQPINKATINKNVPCLPHPKAQIDSIQYLTYDYVARNCWGTVGDS
jgi:hypothetical protein